MESEMNWIKAGIIATITFILAWLLMGCSSTKPTLETRVDTVYVFQNYTDTLNIIRIDTLFMAGDERIIIKIDTLYKRLWYKWTDTVRVIHRDTLTKYVTVVQEKTWWDKIQIYLFPVFLGITVILLIAIWIRK